ncbi:hypothetical protein HZH66_006112 [Vespula vulgaris]|uniref:Uncharacterized protein n=1 Tax=Vespula vulgaris TaxID=7454 RepID=A0A834K649_VESVU|nr:hypothetical protein HZH66_006112 [Vespula vulgaris]
MDGNLRKEKRALSVVPETSIFPRYVYWRYHKLQYTFKVFDLRYDRPKVDFLLSVLEASPFQVQDGRRRQSPYSLNKAVASSSSIRPIDP